jgi:hypothetical protein
MTINISQFIPGDIKVNGTFAPIVTLIPIIMKFSNASSVMSIINRIQMKLISEFPVIFTRAQPVIVAIPTARHNHILRSEINYG